MTTEQLISLPLFSIYDAKILGIITNVYTYKRKIVALLVVDEYDYCEYVVFSRNIYSVGDELVLVTNSKHLHLIQSQELKLSKYFQPLGKLIVATDGSHMGNITSLQFDNRFNILSVASVDKTFDAHNVKICANVAYVGNIQPHKFNPNNTHFATLYRNNHKDIVVHTQTNTEKHKPSVAQLIGMYTTANILSSNGEVLVRKNTKVTSNILLRVSTQGKLNELQLHCKQKT